MMIAERKLHLWLFFDGYYTKKVIQAAQAGPTAAGVQDYKKAASQPSQIDPEREKNGRVGIQCS